MADHQNNPFEREIEEVLESIPEFDAVERPGLLPGQLTKEEIRQRIREGKESTLTDRELKGFERTDIAEEMYLDAMLNDLGGFKDQILKEAVKVYIMDVQRVARGIESPINMEQAEDVANHFREGFMACQRDQSRK